MEILRKFFFKVLLVGQDGGHTAALQTEQDLLT
jgi:hypothetical protein